MPSSGSGACTQAPLTVVAHKAALDESARAPDASARSEDLRLRAWASSDAEGDLLYGEATPAFR